MKNLKHMVLLLAIFVVVPFLLSGCTVFGITFGEDNSDDLPVQTMSIEQVEETV